MIVTPRILAELEQAWREALPMAYEDGLAFIKISYDKAPHTSSKPSRFRSSYSGTTGNKEGLSELTPFLNRNLELHSAPLMH